MRGYEISPQLKEKPVIQLAPLVDIAFWALIFFMVIAIMNQIEAQVAVDLPKSNVAAQNANTAGKIVINITRNGRYIVNQQELDQTGLEEMLRKVSKLFPNQQVIIRADALAYHKYIVQALDSCMRANIGDVSFAAIKTEE